MELWLKRYWRRLTAGITVGLVMLGAGRWALGPSVPVVTAERRALAQRIVATGRVMPPARVNIASTMLGTVAAVPVIEGQRVMAGDLLLQLRDNGEQAALAQARAGLAQALAKQQQLSELSSRLASESVRQARATCEQASKQVERVEKLFEAGVATQEQLDSAHQAATVARSQLDSAHAQAVSIAPGGSDFRLAQASVAQAQAQVAVAESRLNETRITTAVDGLILSRRVEPGDVLQPGQTVLVLAREGETLIYVNPDEKSLRSLRVGQTAAASADAFPNETFPVEVVYLAPAVDASRGTIEVRLLAKNPPDYLRADMTVSVEINAAEQANALLVPGDAVRDPAGRPWVLLVRDGRAERREVKLGARNDEVVEITAGLAVGDQLILPGTPVSDGQRVRPRAPR